MITTQPSQTIELTEAQKAFWLIYKASPSKSIYNVNYAWDTPKIDPERLNECLQILFSRHEAFRTTYRLDINGEPAGFIEPQASTALEVIEFHNRNDQDVESLVESIFLKPIDIENERVYRWVLIQRESADVLIYMHNHINIDLNSMTLFFEELKLIHSQLLLQKPVDLPSVSGGMQQYIDSLKASTTTDKYGERAFWRNKLVGSRLNVPVPTESHQSNNESFHKSFAKISIPANTLSRIQAYCELKSITPFSFYLTAYQLLLSQLSGSQDICVGTATDAKPSDLDSYFNYFVNPVIMRANINHQQNTDEFMVSQNAENLECLKRNQYPFSQLIRHIDLEDGSSTSFNAAFVWENVNRFRNRENPLATLGNDERHDWQLETLGIWRRRDVPQQFDDIDLSLKIYKFQSDMVGCIEYNTHKFSSRRIEFMVESYVYMLEQIAAAEPQKIGDITPYSTRESTLLRDLACGPEVNPNENETFIDRLRSIARSTPQKIAVHDEHRTITYFELLNRAYGISLALHDRGVNPGDVIGVSMHKSIECYAALAGIFMAGCVYLPLDPNYPGERTQMLIEDSGCRLILISGDDHTQGVTHLDVRQIPSQPVPENIEFRLSPNMNAYLIFTSGSTGRPKGVPITHAGVAYLRESLEYHINFQASDNVLQFASLNFDASILEIVGTLQCGATLHTSRKEQLLGESLFDFLMDRKITCALLPPAILASEQPRSLPNLRLLLTGGEACSQKAVDAWAAGRQMFNIYGPTEGAVWCTCGELDAGHPVTIGKPITNTELYLLNDSLKPVNFGSIGEIVIASAGLTPGYMNRNDLTEKSFNVVTIFGEERRIYRTGDLGRYNKEGDIEYLGRIDHQIKIRGHRVELGEIENILHSIDEVEDALTLATDQSGSTQLIAYVASATVNIEKDILQHLKRLLPSYMVPAQIYRLDAFPMTLNGKIDRNALPKHIATHGDKTRPEGATERQIFEVWAALLETDTFGVHDNFFDVGGHSILLAKMHTNLPAHLKQAVSIVDLFKYTTIRQIADFIESNSQADDVIEQDDHLIKLKLRSRLLQQTGENQIAIVGMSGRFPGANTVAQLWENICDQQEAITFYDDQTLLDAGVPASILNNPDYIKAKGRLDNVKGFDANFFGFSAIEAQITDPQQRLFLECAWEALEDGGCAVSTFKRRIGVYAGLGKNNYLSKHIEHNVEITNIVGDYPIMIGNEKDFLASRASYKLNLHGPAVVIQTACSTSLLATHAACQALINHDCDAALAGGVSLGQLKDTGYLYQEGMIMSKDGHCRPFDDGASGTLPSQGAGVVLLKRLEDAIKDKDQIYAVIHGTGTNNDGSEKTGYTAPSIKGQQKAILAAFAASGLEPKDIGLLEAHGTGTPIGDPIEIEALRGIFKRNDQQQCAIGSIKGNIGHLDAASGVTGLIKIAKAVQTKTLPANINFDTLNRKINLSGTSLTIQDTTKPWHSLMPRYAGVSSFGIGGTNAHVIVGEHSRQVAKGIRRPYHPVLLSAKTNSALQVMRHNLAEHLEANPSLDLQDVAFTLARGREHFQHQFSVVCNTLPSAIAALRPGSSEIHKISEKKAAPPKVAFIFPGQGSQYINMGRDLYRAEPLFRETVDYCRGYIKAHFSMQFESLSADDFDCATESLNSTNITQPALFIFQYSLAKLLQSWGIEPDIMAGHSIGEYAAACLAGVFSLEQALELVVIRGYLINQCPAGSMLSIRADEATIAPMLRDGVSIAAINSPESCVISGDSETLAAIQSEIDPSIQSTFLNTSHGFHSPMMTPILPAFEQFVARRMPKAPQKTVISCSTGDLLNQDQACDPAYWSSHIRNTVRFNDALKTLQRNAGDNTVVIEIGPGKALSSIINRYYRERLATVSLTRHALADTHDAKMLMSALENCWHLGIQIDWDRFFAPTCANTVSLPTYPFERKNYWINETSVSHIGSGFDAIDKIESDQSEMIKPSQQIDDLDTAVKRSIHAEWKKYLRCESLGADENFFDLGGDSLLAVGLMQAISTRLGLSIKPSVLIQHPTINLLAGFVESNQIDQSPLVTIQEGYDGCTPLYLVHPIGGEVFFYKDLAVSLGAHQTVYAIEAPSLNTGAQPMESVEEIAKAYIQYIKPYDLESPLKIGGSSFGGLVAYEMAQQLEQAGRKVALVVMIDTPSPTDMPKHVNSSQEIIHYLLGDYVDLNSDAMSELDDEALIQYVYTEAERQNKLDRIPPHLSAGLFKTWLAHTKATFCYGPKPYDGSVAYMQHSEPMRDFPSEPHKAWSQLVTGQFSVAPCPGNHITMNYSPHVMAIAAMLKPLI